MKKMLVLLLAGGLVCFTACTSNEPATDELTEDDEFDLTGLEDAQWTDPSADTGESETSSETDVGFSGYSSGIGDSFFVSSGTYSYLCDSMLEEADYPALINVTIEQCDDSNIYRLVIDEDVNSTFRNSGDWDRLDLGYFLVDDDTVYNLTGISETPSADEIQSEGKLVYVSENALGQYNSRMTDNDYVEWTDGCCTYHYYNDNTESGFYTTIVWDANKNLTSYKSGYGAEREAISFYIPE